MSAKTHNGKWFEDATEVETNENLPSVSHIKGGSESKILEGYIENDNSSATTIINPRRIGGNWKDMPIESTYRLKNHNDSIKQRFMELIYELQEKDFSEWFISKDELSKADKRYNHSLAYMINRIAKRSGLSIKETVELFEYPKVVWDKVKQIYLVDESYIPMKSPDGINHLTADNYQEVAVRWIKYLNYVENVKIYMADITDEDLLVLDPEHRWSKRNARRMLAKFQDLEQSKFSDMYQTMITFTSYQSGELPDDVNKDKLSWFNAMENIKDGLDKITKILRKQGDLHYIWVFEPHKTGYPHVHLLLFGEVAEWLDKYENQKRIRDLWTEKYDIGKKTEYETSSGIGVDFTVKRPDESDKESPINDLSNYLMKYFNKNFGERLSNYDDYGDELEDMNWGPIIYNACMFFTGYRTWGTSQEVGSVMKTERNEGGKKYKNLGGELKASENSEFEDVVRTKGDKELISRIDKREKLRNAIKERKNV